MKEHKTADCVVIGVRWKPGRERLATLLLGLYRDDGELDYVGSAAVAAGRHEELLETCPTYVEIVESQVTEEVA